MPELQWSKTPLPGRASLLAAAVLPGALYAGSTLVTPLYPLYQHRFGLTIMLVCATYVIGNLGALCAFGHASDQAGRRHISLLMLAVGGASALLFLLAVHPAMLFLARAASGLAIGVGAATATADRRPVCRRRQGERESSRRRSQPCRPRRRRSASRPARAVRAMAASHGVPRLPADSRHHGGLHRPDPRDRRRFDTRERAVVVQAAHRRSPLDRAPRSSPPLSPHSPRSHCSAFMLHSCLIFLPTA